MESLNISGNKMKVLSLFANIGIAEACLSDLGICVCVANELVKRRADMYEQIYPGTNMICGDITDKEVYEAILASSKHHEVDTIIATPPCQGMSRAAGIPKDDDERNSLILPVTDIITALKPKYVFIENVKRLLEIKITHKNESYGVSNLLHNLFGKDYHIRIDLIDTKDFSVPQTRKRAIILMSRRDMTPTWDFPQTNKKVSTLHDAIGDLPSLDPFVADITEEERLEMFPKYYQRKEQGLKHSRWHSPPKHISRQIIAMMHTPSGKTAFDNKKNYPKKANGEKVRGYKSTYRRLKWDAPASTVTMDNRKISSQNNVHPGRVIGQNENGDDLYSDARALTIYELMRVMTRPEDWPVPDDSPEAFLRSVMGEGIPPLFLKQVFEGILR
jgi:DNA (cytosine-5)-methyltransferase 1